MRLMRLTDLTFRRFLEHDGWAIASHIALSALMSLFPFLILVAAVAGSLGSGDLADEVARLILDTWPDGVAAPLAREIHTVLTVERRDLLTLGALLAVYFCSNGVESLRIGLNRAYQVYDWRPWWLTRLESVGYVLNGVLVLMVFAALVVLGPLLWRAAVGFIPALAPLQAVIVAARFIIATAVIAVALAIAHLWLPGGRRTLAGVLPGIIATLVLWLVGGAAFGLYLDGFARNYVTTYAGLASGMVTLVFLYMLAAIFLFGGELNAAILDLKEQNSA
ncbi:YihY/virulence factor BrkB family protein [Chelatococcus sp. SYSU_G07232]|uniref:YihY/virulence factor BrkB family protein n=2 Tax=Chelatococcus albus TaxID=3047466 RepID=A0ABT7ADH1_9HYPH|nr:YihY/virulence factor BrkB family protein [Chelatococcus sp. SYSU_G07232]MDJ1157426.1 YihY/virulence factor BrkB family protein [Chelatococcus sp. SYSU_G07232]